MKKTIIVALLFAVMDASAQKMDASKVPDAVKKAFTGKASSATDVKWEKEKGNYEANYKLGNQKKSSAFAPGGAWLETENSIAVTALPAAATEYLAKNYNGQKIKEAAQITMANGENRYEAEIKGTDVIFDAKGTFIKTEKD